MLKEEEEFERIEKQTFCRRTTLGWMVSLTVSFSGIDAIFYYSNKMFEDAGMEDYATLVTSNSNNIFLIYLIYIILYKYIYIVMIGVSSILFSFIGMALVDSTGRRPLVVGGSFMIVCSIVGLIVGGEIDEVGLIITSIGFFMLGYNATLGPIKYACWVELMNHFGVSVAASLIFFWAFVIAIAFPFMVEGMELSGAFGVFLGLSVCCFLYLFFELKESKGMTKYELYPLYLP